MQKRTCRRGGVWGGRTGGKTGGRTGGKRGGRKSHKTCKARRGGTPGDLPFFNKDHVIEGRY